MAGDAERDYNRFLACLLVLLLISVVSLPLIVDCAYLLLIPVVGAPLLGALFILFWVAQIYSRGIHRSPWFALSLVASWYLLATMGFASSYKAASVLGSQVLQNGQCIKAWPELLYFSVVTASTLGYGDLYPVGGIARFLSCAAVIEFWFFFTLAGNRGTPYSFFSFQPELTMQSLLSCLSIW